MLAPTTARMELNWKLFDNNHSVRDTVRDLKVCNRA